MNILGVIPARGGSKRLENKNILPLLGKPLICYTIEHAKRSKLIDMVVCSTDSEEIAEVARGCSCKVIKRPKRLAGDRSKIEDAITHAVRYLEQRYHYSADIVVVLLANIPVRAEGVIDKTIKKLIDTKADSVFTVESVGKYNPCWMVKKGKGDKMIYYKPGRIDRVQDFRPLYINNGAVWAVWSKVLKRKMKRKTNYSPFGEDIRLIVQRRYEGIDIDDANDLLLAETILRQSKK